MPKYDTLWNRLESARPEDLHRLAEILGLHDPKRKEHAELVEAISKALRAAAGHSFLNFFRDPHEFPYKEIVIDAADRLAESIPVTDYRRHRAGDIHTVEEVEEVAWQLYSRVLEKKLADLPDARREELLRSSTKERLAPSGSSYVSLPAANLAGKLLAKGQILPAAGVAALLILPALVWEMGGTNYGKTVPAVIELIQIRKLREAERSL